GHGGGAGHVGRQRKGGRQRRGSRTRVVAHLGIDRNAVVASDAEALRRQGRRVHPVIEDGADHGRVRYVGSIGGREGVDDGRRRKRGDEVVVVVTRGDAGQHHERERQEEAPRGAPRNLRG